jgi:hypothetical protein
MNHLRPLCTNLKIQEIMEQHNSSSEREYLSTKNTISGSYPPRILKGIICMEENENQ